MSGTGVTIMHGCPEDMLTWTQMQAALDAAQHEAALARDELAAYLAKREAEDAQRERALDTLQLLLAAVGDRFEYEFSHDSRRVLAALCEARALLAEVGR